MYDDHIGYINVIYLYLYLKGMTRLNRLSRKCQSRQSQIELKMKNEKIIRIQNELRN